jgi:[ribosomal protein S5]-alanine N-acetyltransferase
MAGGRIHAMLTFPRYPPAPAFRMTTLARRRRSDIAAGLPYAGSGLPTLEAPRLALRWMDTRDLPDLHRLFEETGGTRIWNRSGARPDEASIHLEAIQRGYEQGHLFQWGIARRDDDRVIGTATLSAVDHLQGRAELGLVLRHDQRGKRYGAEALTVLVEHAFATMQLRRIEADVDPRDPAALHTLEGAGFRREGYLRQRWLIDGELQDSVMMGLLAVDWPRG